MAPRGLKRVDGGKSGLAEERLWLVERYMTDTLETHASAHKPSEVPISAARELEAPAESRGLSALLDWELDRPERGDFLLVLVAVALAIAIGVALAIAT